MKIETLICTLLLISPCLRGQSAAHQKGDSLFNANDIEAAIESYLTARAEYRQEKDNYHAEFTEALIGKGLYSLAMYDSLARYLAQLEFAHSDNLFRKNRLLGDLAFARHGDYRKALSYYHKSRKLLKMIESVSDNDRIDLLFYLAEAHNSLQQYDSARFYLTQSLLQANPPDSSTGLQQAKHYYAIAKTFIAEQIPDSVRHYLSKSKRAFALADSLHQDFYYHISHLHEIYAFFYDKIGYRDSVLFHADKEITYLIRSPTTDDISVAEAYTNAANQRINEGLFHQAAELLEKAMELYDTSVSKDHKNLAFAYLVQGRLLSARPQALNEALSFYLEAINIRNNTFGKDHQATAEPKIFAADVLHRMGKYDQALGFYQEVKRIAQAYRNPKSLMDSYLGMGRVYTDLVRYEEALQHLEEGWSILRAAMGNSYFSNGTFAMAMADLHLRQNNDELAAAYFNQAIDVFRLNVGSTHPDIAYACLQLAKLALKQDDYPVSLDLLAQSDKANRLPGFSTDILSIANFGTAIEINSTRAKVLLAQFDSSPNPKLLAEAKNLYLKNSKILFELLLSQREEDDLTYYSSLHKETFKGAISVVRKQLLISPSDQLRGELLVLSEKSRAVLLRLQQLKALNAHHFSPQKVTNEEINKKQELINYYKSLYNATPPEAKVRRNQYKSALFNLNIELNKIKSAINNPYPININTGQAYDLPSIQKEIGEDQTIIEYLIHDERLLIFLLDRDHYIYKEIKLRENIASSVASFKSALKNQDFEAFKRVSSYLYAQLIRPVESNIRNNRIVVIPDGQLWNIHFDLLIQPDQDTITNFRTLPFLLKDFSVSYDYSVSGLIQNQKSTRTSPYDLLAFSYDKDSESTPRLMVMRNSPLSDLPGTSREILNLSKVMPGEYLFGDAASEGSFKKKAEDFRVLHLALHAEADSLDNELTRMYFVQNNQDSLEDGLLYSYEVYSMRLNAELAVLSACNTGSGRLNAGEGIMSLGRAFQYAGVASLLLSQWEVSDAAAPVIIEDFYTGLNKGLPKDEALRQAKLNFLSTSNNLSSNPLYWGSFFILGNANSISIRQQSWMQQNWQLMLLSFSLVVLLGYAVSLKRRAIRSL